MVLFAALRLLSSALSPRLAGRRHKVWDWVRSVEYAGWFMAYVFVVQQLAYLLTAIIFAIQF